MLNLNPEEMRLVIQAIKDKRDNYEMLIRAENNKDLKDKDIRKLDQLTDIWHQYNLVLDAIEGRR